MIVGIGVDVVDLAELATSVVDRPRMSARVFTRSELAYCRALAKPLESLGARFAAKEAAFKAVGCGWAKGVTWKDAQVVATAGQRPTLRICGALARHARAIGATELHLSLSHSGDYAVAVVVAWRADD